MGSRAAKILATQEGRRVATWAAKTNYLVLAIYWGRKGESPKGRQTPGLSYSSTYRN